MAPSSIRQTYVISLALGTFYASASIFHALPAIRRWEAYLLQMYLTLRQPILSANQCDLKCQFSVCAVKRLS